MRSIIYLLLFFIFIPSIALSGESLKEIRSRIQEIIDIVAAKHHEGFLSNFEILVYADTAAVLLYTYKRKGGHDAKLIVSTQTIIDAGKALINQRASSLYSCKKIQKTCTTAFKKLVKNDIATNVLISSLSSFIDTTKRCRSYDECNEKIAKIIKEKIQARLNAEQIRLAEEKRKLDETTKRLEVNVQIQKYANKIREKIERNWRRPPTSRDGLSCTVQARLTPNGDVVYVKIVESSGDQAFDRSVIKAVKLASPLPLPTNKELFERFRNLTFRFAPRECKLCSIDTNWDFLKLVPAL